MLIFFSYTLLKTIKWSFSVFDYTTYLLGMYILFF